MFTLDISDLLKSFEGDSESYELEESIDESVFPEIRLIDPLRLSIKLGRKDYGIEVTIVSANGRVLIPSDEIEKDFSLEGIIREFHLKKDPKDTDDISYINEHDRTIDITEILEQEILIATL